MRGGVVFIVPNDDIGYPKLFIRDGPGPQENPARSTVNNFVAARAAGDFRWPDGFILLSLQRFSRADGSGLRTFSRIDDFEFYGPPAT